MKFRKLSRKTLNLFLKIIHKKWILTAAHCTLDVVKVEVFLGATDLYPGKLLGAAIKKITVTRSRSIIHHPNYDDFSLMNDIGLVELPEDAPIENKFIGLLAMPKGLDLSKNLVGLSATVSGFGEFEI